MTKRTSRRRTKLRLVVFGVLGLTALGLTAATGQLTAFASSPLPVSAPPRLHDLPVYRSPAAFSGLEEPWLPVESSLAPGENLGRVFAGLGLEPAETQAAAEVLAEHLDVRRLKAGEPYVTYFAEDGSRLAAFEWTLGESGRVLLERDDGGWRSSFVPFEREVRVRAVSGVLEESLIASIEGAGGPAALAYRLADVFQWDLDFHRDLRSGDRFEVLFEEVWLDGERSGVGGVLAATYDNAGRLLEAYRFGDDEGYYDGEGRPLRKMFLRSPMPFSRVTSRFSHRRFHPILEIHRPHYGVDYGAPVGTPVRVTAGGVVTFAGYKGQAGKMVKVRHPNGYHTAYLHLSRFAAGIRPGARVAQGQVIGQVGSTGLATAPHLDYRVEHRGRWIDPLSMRSEPAPPLPEESRGEFLAWRDTVRARLEAGAPPPEPSSPGLPDPERRAVASPPVAGIAGR